MKKIILIAVIFLVLLLLYNYVGVVRKLIEKAFLPNSFKEYSFLSENKVGSEDYQIKKIIDGESDREILFNTSTQEFIIKMRDSDYDRNNQGWYALWKIDKKGQVIDSLSSNNGMSPIGIYFEEDHYVDWVESGSKTKKEYEQIINFDSIAPADFNSFVEKAAIIEYAGNYENKKVNCYLKIDDGWVVFESEKGYEDYFSEPEKLFKHKATFTSSLLVLEDRVKPFHRWKDINSFIHVDKFAGESREFKSFYDINNTSRSGWHGTGYFKLWHGSSLLHFKSYVFKSGFGFDPDISIYAPPNNYGDHTRKIDIAFISLSKRMKSNRDYKEVGVYVICKKDKNKTNDN